MADSKKVEVLIVGAGIAGTTLALELRAKGVSIHLIDNQEPNSSSRIAAGLINPIISKGIRKTWQYSQLFPAVFDYYQQWEREFEDRFISRFPYLVMHANTNENKQWERRALGIELAELLEISNFHCPQLILDRHPYITKINHCGRLDVQRFLLAAQHRFMALESFWAEDFIHNSLCCNTENNWCYNNVEAKKVVFCEGMGIVKNPWFNRLFFDPTGGDILTVYIPGLDPAFMYKKKAWLIPTREPFQFLLGNNFFKDDGRTESLSIEADSLIRYAKEITGLPVTLLQHKRGIRPTIQNRRPYLGQHPNKNNLFVYNGLGSKGVSLCSWLSPMMAKHVVDESALPVELDISGFDFHQQIEKTLQDFQ
ncbi:MAG: FAD-binding oxidoreductase [Bacteroidetes bacterium]|nr:FAD-binding oxidoreductase [Bacteroidota bacterium]